MEPQSHEDGKEHKGERKRQLFFCRRCRYPAKSSTPLLVRQRCAELHTNNGVKKMILNRGSSIGRLAREEGVNEKII